MYILNYNYICKHFTINEIRFIIFVPLTQSYNIKMQSSFCYPKGIYKGAELLFNYYSSISYPIIEI